MWCNQVVSAVSHICVGCNLLALSVLSPHHQNIASGAVLHVLRKGLALWVQANGRIISLRLSCCVRACLSLAVSRSQ